MDEISPSAPATRRKLTIAVNMDRVFGHVKSWILCSSSRPIVSFFQDARGKSNYAAGCTFQGQFLRKCCNSSEHNPVKIMNWGYWGSVGVRR